MNSNVVEFPSSDRARAQAELDLYNTPIDFEALIKAGVLKKKGAWYILRRWAELPKHAQVQVVATKAHMGPKEPGVVMIQFRRCARAGQDLGLLQRSFRSLLAIAFKIRRSAKLSAE